ncbi:MAG: hypothetical protein KGL39_50055 [Patescibacteria group bacterium]|nr:hypothetical protein [Patescibacteria group bacterium]
MDSVTPVLTESEVPAEQVIALGQDEYFPIIVARITFADGGKASLTRFRLSDKERELIAAGADLILGQPHHGHMMPISLQLAMPGEYPKE